MEIGDVIKTLRINKQITGRELSRRTGLSQAQLSQIEAGSQKNPTILTLKKIANALEISLINLIAFYETNYDENFKSLYKEEVK